MFHRVFLGEIEPFHLIAKISEKGNQGINGLNEFLYSSSTDTSKRVNKVYAILAFDAIGTPLAIIQLRKAAMEHPNIEVKGTALRILSWDCYNKAKEDSTLLDKLILFTLIRNADDTTMVENVGKRIGEIAREGIKNWSGEDYGELQLDEYYSGPNNKSNNIREHRLAILQENSNKYKWNRITQKFEIKR